MYIAVFIKLRKQVHIWYVYRDVSYVLHATVISHYIILYLHTLYAGPSVLFNIKIRFRLDEVKRSGSSKNRTFCFGVWVSFRISSQSAQLRAPWKQPGPLLTHICIAVGHPQQTLLWLSIEDLAVAILPAGRVLCTRLAGPNITLRFPHLFKLVQDLD